MKFLYSFFLFASIILTVSCSSDDDGLSNVSGKYVVESITSQGCSDTEDEFDLTATANGICQIEEGEFEVDWHVYGTDGD